MRDGGRDRRWLAAGMASVAVHGAVALAAVGAYRATVAPVRPPPPLSVEIVSFEPAQPSAAPVVRPSDPGPANPKREDPSPDTDSTAPAPAAAVESAAAPPPADPPAAAGEIPLPGPTVGPPPADPPAAAGEIPLPGPTAGPPPAAPEPVSSVIAAPKPRPRPALPAARAEPAKPAKPRIDPVPQPLAAKAPAKSATGGSAATRPSPQSARLTGNDVPHDSAARPAAGNPPPAYPRSARRRGLQGRLVLRVRIGADGVAQDVRVIESSGHRLLDASAREAVATWRFTPARRAGLPVASRIDIPVSFQLRR